MAGKPKKTKEWKRRQKRVKERQRASAAIHASQDRLRQEMEMLSAESGGKIRVEERGDRRKLSEIILDFARPLLDVAQTEKDERKALVAAIAIWNISLRPEGEQMEGVRRRFNKMMDHPDEQELSDGWKQAASYLLARKKAYYPDEKRDVVNFDIVETPKGFHLNVVSLEPKMK